MVIEIGIDLNDRRNMTGMTDLKVKVITLHIAIVDRQIKNKEKRVMGNESEVLPSRVECTMFKLILILVIY